MTVTLDGTEGSSRDQRTRTWPTLARYSLVPRRAKPLRVSRIDWRACLVRNLGCPTRRPLRLPVRGVKPVAVGASRVLAGLDQGDRGDLSQPCPLRGPLGLGNHPTLDLGVAELLPGLMGTPPFDQGVVVDHPGAPKCLGERLTLNRGRVDAVAVADKHAADYIWSMRQEDDYRRGRSVVSALNVHLVFVTKNRRGVLSGEHLDALRARPD
jgi:hypothetical protein